MVVERSERAAVARTTCLMRTWPREQREANQYCHQLNRRVGSKRTMHIVPSDVHDTAYLLRQKFVLRMSGIQDASRHFHSTRERHMRLRFG